MRYVRCLSGKLPVNVVATISIVAITSLVLAIRISSGGGIAHDVDDGVIPLAGSFESDSYPPTAHFSRMWWKNLEGNRVGPRGNFGEEAGRNRCQKRLKDRMFVGAGEEPYTFIRYSAYRYSPSSFFVDGLLTNRTGTILGCSWVSDSERVQGQSFHHTAWHKGRDYHTVVVGCHFPHSVGGKEGGGVLLLDLEIDGANSSLLVLQELPTQCERNYPEKDPHFATSSPGGKTDIAFCGAQIFSPGIDPKFMDQWVQYHLVITDHRSHFFIYLGIDPTPSFSKMSQKFVRDGVMTIEDTRGWNSFGTVFFGAQALFLHDCQHRAIGDFKWVINNDYDEYIHFVDPRQTLNAFLKTRIRYSQVSFGSVIFAFIPCDNDNKEEGFLDSKSELWAIERMLFRQQGPDCQRQYNETDDPNFCPPYRGRRKYAANPITALGFGTPHNITVVKGFELFIDPLEVGDGNLEVFVASAEDVFLAHYKHFLTSDGYCSGSIQSFRKSKKALHQFPSASRRFTKRWLKYVGLKNFVKEMRKSRSFT